MSRLLKILAGVCVGYVVGAVAGWLAVQGFSANAHDQSLEAVMTAFFASGPIGAVVGAIVAVLRRQRS